MSTTRPRKDSTVLAPIDIVDQPVGRLIFLTEGSGGTQAFSIDNLRILDDVAYGYRIHKYTLRDVAHERPDSVSFQDVLVIAVPVRSPWTVIARDSVLFRTMEESLQKQKTDQDQTADLIKAVFGALPPLTSSVATVPPAMLPLVPPVGHYI
jgi:hypothetical protein